MNENIIERAAAFAEKAHKGQFRKGTDIPYIVHPKEAMEIVKTLTDDEEVIAAAVLHDVIEDTAFTEDDIRKNENYAIPQKERSGYRVFIRAGKKIRF